MASRRYQDINKFVSADEAYASRVRALERGTDIGILDPTIDLAWAQFQSEKSGIKPYFDYFYAGEDIRVYVGETGDDPEFGDLPIMEFAYSIQQEKMPVYGYASYTYDAMLRGTRIITGAFTIVTKHPNYMKELLAKAARNRANNYRSLADDYPSPEGWREDDRLIHQYWGKNLDDSAMKQQGTIWSVHPPFSFVIVYGIQDTSMEADDTSSYFNAYTENNLLFFDRNERLVEDINERDPSKIMLDACELKSVRRSFTPSQLVFETYEFIARDEFVPTEEYLSAQSKRVSNFRAAIGPGLVQ